MPSEPALFPPIKVQQKNQACSSQSLHCTSRMTQWLNQTQPRHLKKALCFQLLLKAPKEGLHSGQCWNQWQHEGEDTEHPAETKMIELVRCVIVLVIYLLDSPQFASISTTIN
uniref:Mitochondrial outer membrane protein porin 4 n=1 Tax=Rhizophora mucronata TaxID=61149 RepID=A0A2P2LD18_RHIMU